MLWGFALCMACFTVGHWLAAKAMRRSLLKDPSIGTAPRSQQIVAWAAGPVFTYLVIAVCGVPYAMEASGDLTLVVTVVPDYPAQRAGIVDGDQFLAIDGQPLTEWAEVPERIRAAYDEAVAVELLRDGQRRTITVTPEAGKIGVRPQQEAPTVARAAASSLTAPARVMGATGETLWNMVEQREAPTRGPVSVAGAPGGPGARISVFLLLLLGQGFPFALIANAVLFVVFSARARRSLKSAT